MFSADSVNRHRSTFRYFVGHDPFVVKQIKTRAAGVAAELRPGFLRGWRRCVFLAGVGALRA